MASTSRASRAVPKALFVKKMGAPLCTTGLKAIMVW
jgi:hypothetical protein